MIGLALVQLQNIRFNVKDRTLFHINDLNIYQGDRIGLIGRNGSGKTSLLQMINRDIPPASGTITKNASIALLPQIKPQMEQKSGGEISQAIINQTLAQAPELLLADEPTTHLDTNHMEKLEKQLQRRREALVIVSHDRAFMDALCTKIWEIEDGQIREFTGNYSDYAQQKKEARQHHEKEYEKYVQKKKQLEEAMQQKEQKAQRATKKPKNVSKSEAKITGAKPYFAKKQKKLNQGVSSIQSRIDQLDKVEKIKELPPIKMQVTHEESLRNRTIIHGEQVPGTVGNRLLWEVFNFSVIGADKIAVIGPNGSGKTTFLRMMMDGHPTIQVSPSVSFGYFSQTLDVLETDTSILDNVRSTSSHDETLIRTVLARLSFFQNDVFKPVNVLSGGERVKVAFAKIFVSHANTLILDEPTNYLDIEAVEALESLLVDYSGTVIFVSHDRHFLQNVATRIFAISNTTIHTFDGSYNDYMQTTPQNNHDPLQDELLKVETRISDVLSRLSITPTDALEAEFQQLLREKKEINERLQH
ncbi:ABC-F type ribosomal protection protein [Salicibibacter cibarius]|uniref:ABC-F type ribosomal protection protein n=1 Tax=Salicibibacter cibarius TaxID=2743000 RepID=A0A7T7CDP5_9BACI|nr:ABC-F type ribosomal protection protein [Salicibibacter cibarius]